MIVTETEAQNIACPFSRLFDGNWADQPNPTCLGSTCMAWDWVDSETIKANNHDHGQAIPARPVNVSDEAYTSFVTEYMTEQGWTLTEYRGNKGNPLSLISWSRRQPNPRGQCQRTLSLAEDR